MSFLSEVRLDDKFGPFVAFQEALGFIPNLLRARATIYKTSDGKQYLRLTDFTTSNGPDVHVLLGRGDDENLKEEIVKGQLDGVELGSLKGNQGDQNFDLPTSVELQKYNAVVIYCERFHAVFGVARLEQF
jgi:hypothetical protein